MPRQIRIMRNTFKIVFICMVFLFTFAANITAVPLQDEMQAFDLKSAVMISIGFGAALCMLISNLKRV